MHVKNPKLLILIFNLLLKPKLLKLLEIQLASTELLIFNFGLVKGTSYEF